jgi:hypothetical protein
MHDDPPVPVVIYALAAYLRDNPRACDTAEGIRRWWLSPGLACTDDTVLAALEWMRQHAVIDMTTAADGRQRFTRRGSGERLAAVLRELGGDESVH